MMNHQRLAEIGCALMVLRWCANMDIGQYLRTETNHGREESVMLDVHGPGCIVRWWAGGTTPQMGPPGTIRIYLDGEIFPSQFGTGTEDYHRQTLWPLRERHENVHV